MEDIQEVSPDPEVVVVPEDSEDPDDGTALCPPDNNQQPVDCPDLAFPLQLQASAIGSGAVRVVKSVSINQAKSVKSVVKKSKKKKPVKEASDTLKAIEKYKHVSRPRQLSKMAKEIGKCYRRSAKMLMFKLKVLECVDNGSCKDISVLAKNGVELGAIGSILRNRDKHETAASKDWRLEDFRNYSNYEVERGLLEYIISCQEADIPYTRQDLHLQAAAIADTLKMKKFTGTELWLGHFIRRNRLSRLNAEGHFKCEDIKAVAKKLGLDKEQIEEPVPVEEEIVENVLDTPMQDDCEPPAPLLDGEEINEIVPKKKKKKKDMPTACRICSANLVDAGGLRLRDFNVKKAKLWIKDFVGYEVAPVERPDGSEFPYGICWNCVNHFHNWVKKLGKDSEDYWTEAETSIWTAYQCRADASSQTDDTAAVQVESVNVDTPLFSPEDLFGSENSAPQLTGDALLAGVENCDSDLDSELTLSAEESSLMTELSSTFDPLDVKPEIPRMCKREIDIGRVVKKSPKTTPVKSSGPLKNKSSRQNQIQRVELLCPLCNKMFTVWRQLLKHNRECQTKAFPLKADLMRCSVCQFASFNDSDMKDHSCLQNGQTACSVLHVCTLCKVGFKTGNEFWRHVCL